ncbi:PP2C family protein-serine/threonine phosphatase [Gracilinema caldarium]|uniref:PP2C family protein-serine/threonine phosphatase n=1 Tax=Gracilinema caldarium TaxID=215591 RepID=UPI0026E9D2C5|nr:fused response regulator/phosphatase [Gracilinema caldarium]
MNEIYELVLVDDEIKVTEALEREIRLVFTGSQFSVKTFNDPVVSAEYIANHADTIFLVISDLRMPVMSGSDLLTFVRATSPEIQTVLLTAFSDIEQIQKAISASIQSLLFKPWTRESLKAEINKAFDIWKVRRENRILSSRIDAMLREAGDFQKNLFASSIPVIPNLQIDVSFIPVETFHCGGDFFEFRRDANNNVFVILGDVSGHGLKSAMVAVMLKTAMDDLLNSNPKLPEHPDFFLSALNAYYYRLLKSAPEILVGIAVLNINTDTGQLVLAIAGLPSILRVHRNEAEMISSGNPMLGAFLEANFTKIEQQFSPGDHLFIYTDGLIESVPHFYSMDEKEIISIVRSEIEKPIEHIVSSFRASLPEACFTDDVSLISIRYSLEKSGE